LPKLSNLLDQQLSRYSFLVDELERPGPYPDRNVFALRLLSICDETSQTDVSERAYDVGKDLYEPGRFDARHHSSDVRDRPTIARARMSWITHGRAKSLSVEVAPVIFLAPRAVARSVRHPRHAINRPTAAK
jgi:hypothetical protein